MAKCVSCSKKVVTKSAASMFNISSDKIDKSKAAYILYDVIKNAKIAAHNEKFKFMVDLNAVYSSMFNINTNGIYQTSSEASSVHYSYNFAFSDIAKIESSRYIHLSSDIYTTSSPSNAITIYTKYSNSVFYMKVYYKKYKGRDSEQVIIEKTINSYADLLEVVMAINNALLQLNFRVSPKFDLNSTSLDDLLKSVSFLKLKNTSNTTIDKLFDNILDEGNIDKLAKLFMCSDKVRQFYIKDKISKLY